MAEINYRSKDNFIEDTSVSRSVGPADRTQTSDADRARPSEAEQLALDMLCFARNQLLIRLRFLEPAFLQLSLAPDPEGTLSTDGFFIYYSFVHVLRRYQTSPSCVSYDYLHMILHCLFHHPFVGPAADRIVWDTASDIAVCAAILDMDLPYTRTGRTDRQAEMIRALRADVPLLTAERLYHFFREIDCEPERLLTMRELFYSDDHEKWYTHSLSAQSEADKEADADADEGSEETSEEAVGKEDQSADEDGEKIPASGSASSAPAGEDMTADEANALSPSTLESSRAWRDISGRIQTDLETTSGEFGQKAASVLRALKEVNRERYDYEEFLRRFCVPTEILKTSEEEFDYIYYTYGLSLYEKMPLVEPLEYSDRQRIREFVIIIDTSASVDGEIVQAFVRKTWNLLKSSETFLHTVNIHIVQCDAEVQGDLCLTSQEDFDRFLEDFELRGFGGTDFRPAFDYIDALINQGVFTNLAGAIYFTDGDGTYPESEPAYRTAFVFIEDNYTDRNVPVWAVKLILEKEDIEK